MPPFDSGDDYGGEMVDKYDLKFTVRAVEGVPPYPDQERIASGIRYFCTIAAEIGREMGRARKRDVKEAEHRLQD